MPGRFWNDFFRCIRNAGARERPYEASQVRVWSSARVYAGSRFRHVPGGGCASARGYFSVVGTGMPEPYPA